jgi:drug/metabolite transporter (DMT)-like permease
VLKDGTLWWGIAAGLLFTAEFILVYWGLEFTDTTRAAIFINISPFVVAIGAQLFIPGETAADDAGPWVMLHVCQHRRRA